MASNEKPPAARGDCMDRCMGRAIRMSESTGRPARAERLHIAAPTPAGPCKLQCRQVGDAATRTTERAGWRGGCMSGGAGQSAKGNSMRVLPALATLLFSSALFAAPSPSKPAEPFAFADFSWVPGNYGAPEHPLSFGPFTGELRVDTVFHYSFNNPKD